MEDNAVRRRIREMITTGALPCEDPPHLWAGHGDGKRCAGCAEPVTSGDIEYETALTSGKMIPLHRRCSPSGRRSVSRARRPRQPPGSAGLTIETVQHRTAPQHLVGSRRRSSIRDVKFVSGMDVSRSGSRQSARAKARHLRACDYLAEAARVLRRPHCWCVSTKR
jgi:hypothetical protein